jgi:glutathione S-transferase
MLIVHTFVQAGWGIVNPSPFCAKLELLLRMRGIPHTLRPSLLATGAPKGKLPWIEHDGLKLGDSEIIAQHLRKLWGPLPQDTAIAPKREAVLHLLRKTLEESVYFYMVSERWQNDAVRSAYASCLSRSLPRAMRPLFVAAATRALQKQLWQQGAGRHSQAELVEMANADFRAACLVLGDEPFFAGAQPGSIDAVAFAFLANFAFTTTQTPMSERLAEHTPLIDYLHRMRVYLRL